MWCHASCLVYCNAVLARLDHYTRHEFHTAFVDDVSFGALLIQTEVNLKLELRLSILCEDDSLADTNHLTIPETVALRHLFCHGNNIGGSESEFGLPGSWANRELSYQQRRSYLHTIVSHVFRSSWP